MITDLCGRTVAIVEGTIYVDILRGLGEYADSGVERQCTSAGLLPVELDEYQTEADAVAGFAAGEADAFIGNEAVIVEYPGFELSAAELPRLRNGIGHRQAATALDEALRAGLEP